LPSKKHVRTVGTIPRRLRTKFLLGKNKGDILYIAVIGHPDDVYYAFPRVGWDEPKTIYRASLV
jgi:hypothetical protein